jgi:lysophospholipase L1-like esterase
MKRPISLFYQNQEKLKPIDSTKIDRFENEIENFRRFDNRNSLAKNPVLFVGSSSIVYWETSISFPEFPVINRGFGGASLPEIIHYYDDIIKKHSPSILVVYSDIDVENGKSPDEAVNAFKELVNKVKKDFPETQILILSIKPALIDNFIGKDVRKNKLISNKLLLEYCNEERNLHFVDITPPMLKPDGSLRSDIFLSDGMHMNSLGYALWSPIIREKIASLTKREI